MFFFFCNWVSHTLQLLAVHLSVDGLIAAFPSESHPLHLIRHKPWASFDTNLAFAWVCEVVLLSVQLLLYILFQYRPPFFIRSNHFGAFWTATLCRCPCHVNGKIWSVYMGSICPICWFFYFLQVVQKVVLLMPNFPASSHAIRCRSALTGTQMLSVNSWGLTTSWLIFKVELTMLEFLELIASCAKTNCFL